MVTQPQGVLGKPYRYAEHLLPHDAGSRDLSSAEKTREQLLRALGLKNLRVLPNASVATGIEQVRLRFWAHAYLDEDRCRALLARPRELSLGVEC